MSISQTERIKLLPCWKEELCKEFKKPYMKNLREFLVTQYNSGKKIYPSKNSIFKALNSTPLSKVKVIILGQDPYHNPNQADGLCFSVPPNIAIPPSLRNIYREIKRDLNIIMPSHGSLYTWSRQGVLLLNSTLTVEERKPASHTHKGWENFTDHIIQLVSRKNPALVFLLWGNYARSKEKLIDTTKHLVLTSVHPSPLSAHRGFLGNGHFGKTNKFLEMNGLGSIEWKIPEIG